MKFSSVSPGAIGLFQLAAKRAFDILIAGTALIVLSPLLLLLSLAIKLDTRGPVVSSHIRYCYNNQGIRILKFRCNAVGRPLTRIGRLLSPSGLDQLPMLVDVLRGQMSMVGPCTYSAPLSMPLAPYAPQLYPLRPGLTGWAQLHVARSRDAKPDIRRQIDDDLFYLKNWSLLLDSKIIVMTLVSGASYMLK